MIKILVFALLISSAAYGQTYFGKSSFPADGDSNTAHSITLIPPAGMESGDLIIFIFVSATSSGEATSSGVTTINTGGQSIPDIGGNNGSSGSNGIFIYGKYCFFNGAWTDNPQFMFAGANTTAKSAMMVVFRKRENAAFWRQDGNRAFGFPQLVSAPNYRYNQASSKTTIYSNDIVISFGVANQPATFTNPTAGWSIAAQSKNSSGAAMYCVYKIQASPGASGKCDIDADQTCYMRAHTPAFNNYGDNFGLPLYFYPL